MSRLAHRAFFLDDEEKTHAVELREAVGIKNRIHLNRYCLAPMLEKGLVVRTDPEHPNSPHQEYSFSFCRRRAHA